MSRQDIVVVGLGNPGGEYVDTRHNIGFHVVDEMVLRSGIGGSFREKYQALYCPINYAGKKIHCVKPLTFMNRSGQSVVQFVNFFKVSPSQLVVIHDDLDMAVARVKLVKAGGTGGHNGIKSIVSSLGTADFFRLKIGIGRPGQGDVHRDFPVDKYVLSNFSAEETELLSSRFENILKGLEYLFEGDAERAKGALNSLK